MATDPRLGMRTLRHLGRDIVWATGAKIGQALDAVAFVGKQFGRGEVNYQCAPIQGWLVGGQPFGDYLHYPRRPEFTES